VDDGIYDRVFPKAQASTSLFSFLL